MTMKIRNHTHISSLLFVVFCWFWQGICSGICDFLSCLMDQHTILQNIHFTKFLRYSSPFYYCKKRNVKGYSYLLSIMNPMWSCSVFPNSYGSVDGVVAVNWMGITIQPLVSSGAESSECISGFCWLSVCNNSNQWGGILLQKNPHRKYLLW